MDKIEYMPSKPVYGIAYVPYSKFEQLHPVDKALERGTLFKVLDIPFFISIRESTHHFFISALGFDIVF